MPHRDPQLPQHVRLSLVPQIALCVTLLACADPRYAEDQGADAGSGDSGAVDLGQDAMMPVDVGTDDGNIGDDAAIDAGEDASVDAGYDAGCSTLCYVDNDDDGYAASGASTVVACTCGTGLAAAAPTTHPTTDCNDNLAAVGPATATDPLRCGTCANVCATTTNGAPACVGGSCSISCDNGYALVTGACVAIMPPRQIAPMSTATTTSQRPTFDWELAPNTTGGRLQICAQRSCSNVLVQLDVTGNSARPASNLTAGHYYWRVFGRNGSRVGLTPSVVWQVHVPARSAPAIDSSAGQASDFNGDGYGDVVVGAQSSDSEVGRVHIFYGSSGGLSVSPDRSLVSPGGAGGNFGSLLESAGDVNGDGYVDLVVSAPGASGVGRTYLYLGSSTGLPLTPNNTLYPPSVGTKYFSRGLSGGDINGDGYADIVVGGTPTASTLGGSIHVFYGSATGPSDQPDLSVTGANDVEFAYYLDVGDFEGDGFADVLVSARSLNQAYVYPGSAAGLLTTRTTLTSPSSGFHGQGGLRAVGDLNGDGRGDAAVGDYAGGSGFVHVYYGGGAGLPSAPATSLGSPGGCCFGSSVRGGRNVDVNRDGYMDLVVGNVLYPASGADRQGRAYVFLGGPSGVGPGPQTDIPNPDGTDAYFGTHVGAGDVDGDGFSDLIVGSLPGTRAGRVHVYRGSGTGVSMTSSWILNSPDGAGSYFGQFVADARQHRERPWRPFSAPQRFTLPESWTL